MKDFNIKFSNFIYQYLPPMKRTAVRLDWLMSLINLQGLFSNFSAWRSSFRDKIQINSQKLILQEHLQRLFGQGILIQNYINTTVLIGLYEERNYLKSFGKNDENFFVEIPLDGENVFDFSDCDFLVLAPENVDQIKLTDEIDLYKLADKTYNILITKN